jgi:NitT/TauT family transport system ATP-binding protein
MAVGLDVAGHFGEHLSISLFRITKTFGSGRGTLTIFSDLTLEIVRGSVVSILGASGCGKTTLLNIIAGVDSFQRGKADVPEARIGYMFQTDMLLPWRTARRNALLPLELRGIGPIGDSRVDEYFERLNLAGVQGTYPRQLSGGMRQRVALIRTLVFNPTLLLMDEPFSALDYETKLSLEDEVLRFAEKGERTVVFVTHDIDEAIAVGQRLIVLQGRPASIVLDIPVAFDSDVVGRRPVDVRQDPNFAQYFRQVWGALQAHPDRES